MFEAFRKVLTDFLASEKAMAAFGVLAGATVLTALGHMTVDQWRETALVTLGIYTAGKTIQGATATIAQSKTDTNRAQVDVAGKITEALTAAVSDATSTTKRPPSQG